MSEVGFRIARASICRVCVVSSRLKTLAMCAVLFGSAAQLQGMPAQVGRQATTIRFITVRGQDPDLEVEITASRPITPQTQTVTDPDRLIVDFPEAVPGAGLQKIPIDRGKLKAVRVGLLSANPPITRVVLDLAAPTEYRVSSLANTIVVKLGSEPGTEAASVAPTTKPSADAQPEETNSTVPTPPPTQSSVRSPLRWIMPILVVTAIMAMLVIAVVVHLQNRRSHRGL